MPDNLTPMGAKSQPLPRILRWSEIPKGGDLEANAAISRTLPNGAYFEFGGGLGDVISTSSRSAIFSKLDEGAEAVVTIVSHNPHCWEIFGFHPGARRLTILDIPYSEVQGSFGFHSQEFRSRYGLPYPAPQAKGFSYGEGLRFHATPEDLAVIESLPTAYVSLSPTASLGPGDKRTVPDGILREVIRVVCGSLGLKLVVVGRDYRINGSESKHVEKAVGGDGVLSVAGRLTVPGSAELMRRAVASVVCDSAMGCAAGAMRIPRFGLISDEMWRACSGPPLGYGPIMDPRNYQCRFGAFRPELLQDFIGKYV